jgi:hypothetical protein
MLSSISCWSLIRNSNQIYFESTDRNSFTWAGWQKCKRSGGYNRNKLKLKGVSFPLRLWKFPNSSTALRKVWLSLHRVWWRWQSVGVYGHVLLILIQNRTKSEGYTGKISILSLSIVCLWLHRFTQNSQLLCQILYQIHLNQPRNREIKVIDSLTPFSEVWPLLWPLSWASRLLKLL